MSVQAGIWNFDGEPIDRGFLTTLSAQVAEHGPDGEHFHIIGNIGMLYRPFHTTSESYLERQPLLCKRAVITWDGRLDNRDELISQLCRWIDAGATDVAIVGVAYERWGMECFAKLIGDWAVAVWNPNERELVLARDYIGSRNLFYYKNDKKILWCNHLLPIALCGDLFTLSDQYIAGFLALHPDADLTPYQEVRSVAPGSWLRIRDGQLSGGRHWSFRPRNKIFYKNDPEYEEHFRHLFRQAVQRRLRSPAPILAELSGGLDSSAIVCMADCIVGKDGTGGPRIDTWSYCDRGEPDEDDFLYFTKVEEKRGRRGYHTELRAAGETFLFDSPGFQAAPGFGVRQELKEAQAETFKLGGYRVVLSGIGGDELLGQALDPRVQMADFLVTGQFWKLASLLFTWSLRLRIPLLKLGTEVLQFALPQPIRSRLTGAQNNVVPWISRVFADRHSIASRVMAAAEGSWAWLPSDRDSFHTLTTLARQLTHFPPPAVEKRYPYLDRTLVEFLVSIPLDQMLRPGDRRSLMRRALSELLPREVLLRRTKAGTGRCVAMAVQKQWDVLLAVMRSLISEGLGYICHEELEKTLLALRSGSVPPYFVQLLRAISLELWLRSAVRHGVLSTDVQSTKRLNVVSYNECEYLNRQRATKLKYERKEG